MVFHVQPAADGGMSAAAAIVTEFELLGPPETTLTVERPFATTWIARSATSRSGTNCSGGVPAHISAAS